MNGTERFAFVGELQLYTYRNLFPNSAPTAEPTFKQLKSLFDSGQLPNVVYQSATLSLRELDVSEAGFAKMLFWLVDPTIPDPDYADQATGTKRTAKRRKGEEPVRSAHVLIDTRSQHDPRRSYPMCIEDVDYIPRSLVVHFFNECFEAHFKKKKKRPDKKDEKVYRPSGKFIAPHAHTLDGVLDKGGVLKGVKWVQERVVSNTFGDKTYPVFEHQDVQMSVQNRPTADNAKKLLKDIWNNQKSKKLKGLKVTIEDEFSNQKTLSADLRLNDILSNVFLKKSHLQGFLTPLSLCEDQVRSDMIDKMKDALKP